MSVWRFLTGMGLVAIAIAAFRFGQRRGGRYDLGSVSDQWRAQQRGNPEDPAF